MLTAVVPNTPSPSVTRPFFFDREALVRLAAANREKFRSAAPFPHVVIDGLIPDEVLDGVLTEFPTPGWEHWERFESVRERKLSVSEERSMGPRTRHLLAQLNGATFVEFLESMTGIEGLITDPWFFGGGLHQIVRGGLLKVHADFNWHERLRVDRRLNLLVYLNRGWKEDYGGHLELWDRAMAKAEVKVLPVFGRCVVFATTDHSFHGHPDPLNCPEGTSRKSLALYYYSNGRPASELTGSHSTRFQPRPGEVWRRETPSATRWLLRLAPPVLSDAARRLRWRPRR